MNNQILRAVEEATHLKAHKRLRSSLVFRSVAHRFSFVKLRRLNYVWWLPHTENQDVKAFVFLSLK